MLLLGHVHGCSHGGTGRKGELPPPLAGGKQKESILDYDKGKFVVYAFLFILNLKKISQELAKTCLGISLKLQRFF